ncbi:MAG: AraC family transcriptional regulator [Devosia sp.]
MMPARPGPVFQKPADAYDPRGRLDPAGFARNVQFATRPPPADLRLFVEHFWSVGWDVAEGTYESAELMHRPYVDLFVSADSSGIQGTFRGKRIYPATGAGRILGIRFRPGGFKAFWPGRMADLQDRNADLAEAFPDIAPSFTPGLLALDDDTAAQAFADLLRTRSPRFDGDIDLINAIIAAIETDDTLRSVGAIGEMFNRSERWLQQIFSDYVGIGLKWLLQRHRLLAAAAQIRATETPDWASIAYDLGYSSQQHFITDFRKVLGETPVQYKAGLTTDR